MKMANYSILTVALALLSVMSSCRKDLCYNHFRTASLSLYWEQEWERDYGMGHAANWDPGFYGIGYSDLRPALPEWVKLITYYSDKNPRETFLTPQGGKVNVDDAEEHSFLLYNGDTEYIVLSDIASLQEVRASTTTRSRSSLEYIASVYPSVRTINPPDVLYAAYIENVPYIDLHEMKQMEVKMQPLVYTYIVRYEFDYGNQHIALARGALGGMAESVYLRDGYTSEESAIILYDCELTSYGCEAHVRSFGIPGFPDEYYGRSSSTRTQNPYTLNLEVKLNNGKTIEFNEDVTEQMAKQPRGGIIRISGLRIEDEQSFSDSGFDVDVTDWGEHADIDLPVGIN